MISRIAAHIPDEPKPPAVAVGSSDWLGVCISVDGMPYRAVANVDRTEFRATLVRPLAITTGSTLTDERGAHYRVEQCEQTRDGCARMRVRLIA